MSVALEPHETSLTINTAAEQTDFEDDESEEDEDELEDGYTMFSVVTSKPMGATTSGASGSTPVTTPRRVKERIRRISQAESSIDMHLLPWRRQRQPDAMVKASLLSALKKNRFTRVLNGASLEAMVAGMEYFELAPGDVLTKQGEAGKYFFVVDSGSFEEQLNNATVGTLSTGQSFGGLALVYNTGRASTIVAKTAGGVWGVKGDQFRSLLQEHGKSHYAENRHLLDQLSMFDGLPAKKKERVGHLALFDEIYEPGHHIKRAKAKLPAIYIVKSGKLIAKNEAGEEVQRFGPGDCFGWRAVMYGELMDVDIFCKERCELVGIGIGALERAVGQNFATLLIRSYVVSVLRKTPVFSMLPVLQVRKIAEAAVVRLLSEGKTLDNDPVLAIVVDGSASWERESGSKRLQRGDMYQHPELQLMQSQLGMNSTSSGSAGVAGKVWALAPGCRFATISREAMVSALRALDLPVSLEDDGGLSFLKKTIFVRKVPIFKELSDEQITHLAMSLESKRLPQGSSVFEQGTVGDAFYIITAGKVEILIDGKHIRELGPAASFGERALLFNEPRSATVKVLEDDDLELWVMNQEAFRSAITEAMRVNLTKTIQYQGTNVTMKDIKHVRFIGAGAFGTVRLVEHKRTGLRYALKRIRKKEDGEVAPEVTREVELLAENHHPFLLHFVATFESAKSKYILTELVTGGQLHEQVLDKMGVLPRKAAQFYIGSLALTLETIHERNIAFRDLKPENVMLDQQGYIKLVDFGLAKRLDESTPRTYTVAGTVMYMAPEVVQGSGYGTECDIWSLGVMLYEFVCGELPFGQDAESSHAIFDDILEKPLTFPSRYNDNAGKKFIQALLNKDLENRLGAGSTGWTDIKANKFFKQGVSGNLFSLITGRELDAPLVPEGEEYSSELSIADKITESDAEELGSDEATDVGCRLLSTFKRFDLNGDGLIDKDELSTVLTKLDPKTFSKEKVDRLYDHIDRQRKGALAYDDFVAWIVNEKGFSLKDSLRTSIKLDFCA